LAASRKLSAFFGFGRRSVKAQLAALQSAAEGLQPNIMFNTKGGMAMNKEEKLDLIAAFESGYSRVQELIFDLGDEDLKFVPRIQDAWSINDFLLHFLDAEISVAFRIRTAIAEPGKAVPLWEEEAWHDALHYDDEDGTACLALAKGIRGYVAAGLRSIVDADWTKFSIMHPAKGRMELAAVIETYIQHIAFHLPLIRRNIQELQKRSY
jgi:hypothetical protein